MTEREILTVDEIKRRALVDEIHLLLRECTVEQQSFFNTLYPGLLSARTESELVSAYNLVVRTIRKNRKKVEES